MARAFSKKDEETLRQLHAHGVSRNEIARHKEWQRLWAVIDTALFIKRSTGAVGIGNITAPAAKLDGSEAGSRHTVGAIQTTSSTVAFAEYAGILGSSANRYFDGRVSGDSSGRIAIMGPGEIQIGDGGAGGRDTNLYRSAASVLTTDDNGATHAAPSARTDDAADRRPLSG